VILQQQYSLVQHSREAVLNFVETSIGEDLNTPVPAFDNKTIRHLLEHNASCYFFWLAYFALQQPAGSLKDEGFITMPLIRRLYGQVDEVMAAFLEKYGDNLNVPVNGVPDEWGPRSATPLQLFTHVVTHEFHHKGQILAMCRQLGYIPPDTDISLSFVYEL
jgi:uncharacterized damage-inducible protein DinB